MAKLMVGQPEILKEINRANVLDILLEARVISRPQLANRTGLSRVTIAMLVDELLGLGLVRERGVGSSGGGRPPVILEFNPDAALAMGASLHNHRWDLVLTNLDGRVIRRSSVLLEGLTPENTIDALCKGVRQITADLDTARLLPAIGVGTPGLVDIYAGVVKSAVDVGWFDVPIRQMVEEALGMPAFVANRSKVGALAELWCRRTDNFQNLIYISIGTGIAAGIVLQRQLYMGTNSSAGELGHVTVLPDGPLCGCGNRGCLQALVSGPAIANHAREQLRASEESILLTLVDGHPERITAEIVFTAASQGDKVAQAIVANTASILGIAVANLINLFNPEQIILGGPVGQSSQVLLGPLRAEVQRRAMAYPVSVVQIETSTLGSDAAAIGAAVLVLQQASELLFFAREPSATPQQAPVAEQSPG